MKSIRKAVLFTIVCGLTLLMSVNGYTAGVGAESNGIQATQEESLEVLINASIMESVMQARAEHVEKKLNEGLDKPMRIEVVDLFAANIVLRFVFDSSVLSEDDILFFIEDRSDNLAVASFMSPADGVMYATVTPVEILEANTPFGGNEPNLTDQGSPKIVYSSYVKNKIKLHFYNYEPNYPSLTEKWKNDVEKGRYMSEWTELYTVSPN